MLSLEASHDCAIAQRVQQISRETVRINQGSLYRRCTASNKALAEIGVAPVGNRPRCRFYALTRAGHQQLAREKASWDQLTAAVRLIFNEGA